MNILEKLLDEKNHDLIYFKNDETEEIYRFEQVAVLPYKENIYCILKPIDIMKNVKKDEAVVFYVAEEEDNYVLKVETDELTSLRAFEIYYDLLEKSWEEEE